MAREVLRSYGSLRAETDVMRCKVYSSLLPAYKLLGEEDEFVRLLATMRSMLPAVKAAQSRALAACDALRLHGQQSLPADGARGCGPVVV